MVVSATTTEGVVNQGSVGEREWEGETVRKKDGEKRRDGERERDRERGNTKAEEGKVSSVNHLLNTHTQV